MAEIALAFLKMNLAGAAAVLVVTALRKPARKIFDAQTAYGLWLAVPLAAMGALAPARAHLVSIVPQTVGPNLPPAPLAALPIQTASFDPMVLIVSLWSAGVLASLLLTLHNQRRFVAASARGQAGPAVIGVLRPRIVTPDGFADAFTIAEQDLVLAHERLHIRRQDSRLNGLIVLTQCLCWFNPLIHWGARLLRLDQEMACDEAVITRFPAARADYARALVKAQLANRPLPLGCYWPSRTGHPLVERLTMINREGSSRARRLTGGAIIALLAATGGAAAWAAQPARTIAVFRPASVVAERLALPEMLPVAPAETKPGATKHAVLKSSAAQQADFAAGSNGAKPIIEPQADWRHADETVTAAPIAIPQPEAPQDSAQVPQTAAVETVQIPVVGPADWLRHPTADQMRNLLPPEVAKAGLKGEVILRCRVNAVGAVSDCLVFAQSEPSATLRDTALKTAGLFRIKPRLVNGHPAEEVLLPLKFDVTVNSLGSYPMRPFPSFYTNNYYGPQMPSQVGGRVVR